jgi:hypothetical protein
MPPMNRSRGALTTFRSAVALAMALWCAGTGCMMVSYARAAALSSEPLPAQSPKHSFSGVTISAAAHACCKARRSSSKKSAEAQTSSPSKMLADFEQVALPESPTPVGAATCCPLTSGSFVTASHSNSDGDNVSIAAHSESTIPTISGVRPAANGTLRLPNQKQSYLRYCVFQI